MKNLQRTSDDAASSTTTATAAATGITRGRKAGWTHLWIQRNKLAFRLRPSLSHVVVLAVVLCPRPKARPQKLPVRQIENEPLRVELSD